MAPRFRRLALSAAFILAFAGGSAPAQAQPTELFFSEYVEGSSNDELHEHRLVSRTTYYFQVKAQDAAGNVAPASNTASATTRGSGNAAVPAPRVFSRRNAGRRVGPGGTSGATRRSGDEAASLQLA